MFKKTHYLVANADAEPYAYACAPCGTLVTRACLGLHEQREVRAASLLSDLFYFILLIMKRYIDACLHKQREVRAASLLSDLFYFICFFIL